MTTSTRADHALHSTDRLPLGNLLPLALAGFVTIMTEVMPAGLLPQIGASLGIAESMAGQFVTAYAVGSLVTAIPLMLVTQTFRRRALLLIPIAGFSVVNAVTAISNAYWLTLVARFFAGMFGGLVWALLVGYAARLAPPHLAGRAIAITGIGAPLAFSFGVPAGTWLGIIVGWRLTFALMSVVALVLIGWISARLPDFPGQKADGRFSISDVLALSGLKAVLFVMLSFVVANYTLYTYIAPFLGAYGLANRVDLILFIFGLAGLFGLWVVGAAIDRHLRLMTLASLLAFSGLAFVLGLGEAPVAVLFVSVFVWGTIVGGAPTLFQTASARVSRAATDVAQAIFVTVWNTGIALGGLLGGLLLAGYGPKILPWALFVLSIPGLFVAARFFGRAGHIRLVEGPRRSPSDRD